jgi:hypothetical protein
MFDEAIKRWYLQLYDVSGGKPDGRLRFDLSKNRKKWH